MPAAFLLLMLAQFASALADNALLIVTVALLRAQAVPPWCTPLLKVAFIASYVVLAPFVGPLADAFPKARLMAWMNFVKVAGVLALLLGMDPLLAFLVVGLGAAAYAPAKYGLATELVPAARLVAANGWIEVTAVGAVLLGTGLGGLLVGPGLATGAALRPAFMLLLAVYVVAGLLNFGVRDSGVRHPVGSVHPLAMTREFMRANRRLWRDRDGGLSLAVTTIFWGVGATLQFAVLKWADERLHLPLEQAAFVQAVVALGVIGGAVAAGRWVPLHGARRMLGAGVVFGLLMVPVAFTTDRPVAIALLVAVGVVGGLMVVPLNALLQERGHALLSAGRSIAVQGANENASVLVCVSVYTGLLAAGVPIVTLIAGLGVCVAGGLAALAWADRRCRLADDQTGERPADARA